MKIVENHIIIDVVFKKRIKIGYIMGRNKKTDSHRSHNLLTFRSSVEAKMYITELEKINAQKNQA